MSEVKKNNCENCIHGFNSWMPGGLTTQSCTIIGCQGAWENQKHGDCRHYDEGFKNGR